MKKLPSIIILTSFTFLFLFSQISVKNVFAAIGKWERFVLSLPNSSYSDNPFELKVDATFTHSGGTQINLPGYYDGNNTWKIGFMPTKTGTWTYRTSSSDSDLNGKTGSTNVVESGLPGLLKADSTNSKKWKFADGGYVVPIALRMEIFSEPASTSVFTNAADYMESHNVHMSETRLLEEYGQWGGRHDYIFKGSWQNHEFDLDIWRRFEERLDILTERGLGAHIMLYSDDSGKPGWGGQTATEALVIRYLVARTAGYPVIFYNTGIDISEYRSCSDINWIGAEINNHDPYNHPRSSRHGGGSGGCVMNRQTFDSRGSPNTAQVGSMISIFKSNSIPTSMDDAWGENRGSHQSKNHTEQDIRRAFWKATIAGGVGGLIRGGATGGCHNGFMCINRLEQEWESEQWLKLINPFIQENLGSTFGSMSPNTSVVGGSKVYALTDSSYSKILYLYIGTNDRYDGGSGGALTAKLSGLSKNYNAKWFDPRTGNFINIGNLSGGKDHNLNPPSSDDWVLLLTTDGPISTSTPTPSPPSGGPPGDGNGDGLVNGQDFIIWLTHYGQSISGANNGDYNDSGKVEMGDYVIWIMNY